MKHSLFAIRAIILIAPIYSTAAVALDIDISVTPRAYPDAEEVSNAQVYVTIDNTEHEAEKTEQAYTYRATTDVDISTLPLELASSDGDYVKRTIVLRRRPVERVILSRNIRPFLVTKDQDHSYRPLDNATRQIDAKVAKKQSVAAEYALFELAFNELNNFYSSYGIKVRFNYARTALEHCKEGYSVCELASSICDELKKEYPNNDLIADESISEEELDKCIRIAQQVTDNEKEEAVVRSWTPIEVAYGNGGPGFLFAAEGSRSICDKFEEADIWRQNGKPRYAVCRDAGVSFLKYADYLVEQDKSDSRVRQTLDQSISYLRLAIKHGDKSTKTKTNLALALAKKGEGNGG